jgi:Spy/CpxP family protein refolding chaperone
MSANLMEKAAASGSWNPKVAGLTVLTLVFLCGVAAGALVMHLGWHDRLHQPAFDTPAGRALYFERLRKQLDLTPAQAEQMQSILDDSWQYYRTVLSDSKNRINQVLTEEQRRKFERILQEAQRQ